MLPQLPEPARHPSVVRAAVSPSAALAAAAGAGIGVLVDPHTAVLAIILGAAGWLGRVGVAVLGRWRRRLPTVNIDPWAVPEPWRQYVRQALAARQRFDQTLTSWTAGPLRDRLAILQPQLSRGAEEVWAVARQGATLDGAAGAVRNPTGSGPSTTQLSAELRQVQAEQQRTGADAKDRQASLARTEEAIAAQLRAAARSREAAAEVLDRLRVLTARLDEAVTQLLSLGLEQVSGSGEGSADVVAGSVDALVEEIAALHQGLREAGAASLPGANVGSSPGARPLGELAPGAGAASASITAGGASTSTTPDPGVPALGGGAASTSATPDAGEPAPSAGPPPTSGTS